MVSYLSVIPTEFNLLSSILCFSLRRSNVTYSPTGDRLYATKQFWDLESIVGDEEYYPKTEHVEMAVFQFPLLPSSCASDVHFPRPECHYLAKSSIASLQALDGNQLLVGTNVGIIEIWKCQGQSVPHLMQTLHDPENAAPDDDPDDDLPHAIGALDIAALHCGLLTEERCDFLTGISFWQPSTLDLNQKGVGIAGADFKAMARIRYTNHITNHIQSTCRGSKMLVLSHDEVGWLYLDVYLLLGHRFAFDEYLGATLPSGVEVTNLHPLGEERIRFVNRIKVHHCIELAGEERLERECVMFDANDRFIVITTNYGLADGNGLRSGPGVIVIDLDEHVLP